MILRILFLVYLSSLSGVLFSLEWPLKNPVIRKSFASRSGHSFFPGMILESSKPDIVAFDKGEVVFKEEGRQLDLPLGKKGMLILQHKNGFQSVYGQITSLREFKGFSLREGSIIGRTEGAPFSFRVYDTKLKQSVNPEILLPPVSGGIRTAGLSSVFLGPEEGESKFVLGKKNNLEAGRYRISVRAGRYYRNEDPGKPLLAPYRISSFFLGTRLKGYRLEILREEQGKIYLLSGGNRYLFDEIYNDEGDFRLGELDLNIRKGILEIYSSDVSGEEQSRTIRISSSS